MGPWLRPAILRFRIALAVALALTPACRRQTEPGNNAARGLEYPTGSSLRGSLSTYRPLLDEAARAELRVAGGVLVDLGSADQHKYARGGWRSGWGAMRAMPGQRVVPGEEAKENRFTWTEMKEPRAWLDVALLDTVSKVILRGRSSVPGQVLTLHIGSYQLGTVRLEGHWGLARAEIAPGALPPVGPVRLELRAARTAAHGPHAEVDWLWLGTDSTVIAAAPGPRVGQRSFAGTRRRAIIASGPRTYSFYLVPPADSYFIADLGAAGRSTFTVSATTDGAWTAELLHDTVAGNWHERAVSLDRFAGKAVRLDLRTSEQEGEAGWGEPEIAVAKKSPAAVTSGAPPPRNLLFIVIDSARADAFDPFATGRRTHTPRYDRLARESTVFTRAYNNENWTKPSVATLLSGLYPSTHDTRRIASQLPGKVELLSQRLQREGFATAAFVANPYISEKFGFNRGWDRFRNYGRENRPSEAEHVYGDALAWLEEERDSAPGRPFFLYIQTIDPNVPYEVDEEYWRPFFEGTYSGALGPSISAEDQIALREKKIQPDVRNLSWLRALYLGEISYHDRQMGRFVDQVERMGLRDETLIVVTNDHGEELGEHGRFGHGHELYEEMVRAPLLLSYPPLYPAGSRIDKIVEHVDVAPTVLDALGRHPLPRADGRSLLPLLRGEPVHEPRYALIEFLDERRAIRVGRHKLVIGADDLVELYDLGIDPGERYNLSASRPIARRLCEVHLGEALAVPNKAVRATGVSARVPFRSGTVEIDRAMRRQLEALGYFGSGPDSMANSSAHRRSPRRAGRVRQAGIAVPAEQ